MATTPTPDQRAFAADIAQDIRNARAAEAGIAEERAIWVDTVRRAALAAGDQAETLITSILEIEPEVAGFDDDERKAVSQAANLIRQAVRLLEVQGLGS